MEYCELLHKNGKSTWKLYRQIVGIPMGTNCAALVADLFLFYFCFTHYFCYERDFMLSLSDIDQTDIIEAFNSTSRYLDDLLNIDNPYLCMVLETKICRSACCEAGLFVEMKRNTRLL